MIPVGNTVVPPNPQQGLSALSSIVGLRQQQQNLQTGQALQQTAQAQAQQQQLQASQAQGVQNFFSSWDPSQHISDDGTTDIESAIQSSQFQNAGNAKPAIMQSLLDIKNKQLTNKQSLTSLNTSLLGQLGTQIGAAAKDSDVVADTTDPNTGVNAGRAKVSQLLTNFAKLSPDAARVAQIYGPMVDHAPPGKLGAAVQALQLQAQSASEQQAQQNPRQLSVGAGATTKVYNVQPSTGIQPGQQPATSVDYVTPPQNVPSPGGGTMHVGPGGAGLPNASAAGGGQAPPPATSKLPPLQQPAPNAPAGQWQNYNAQMKASSDLITGARNAANDPMNGVQATRFRNQQIMDLIPHAATGPGLKLLNTLASRLPGSTGDAYQDLEHYTAQNSAALAQKMGVPNTNLGAETAAAAAGNAERNPGALAEITKTNDALNTSFDLFNRGLAKVSNNGSDPSRVNAYQQAFGQNLDINAVRWADAHRRGDTEELTRLNNELGPNGIAAAQQKLKTLKALSDTGDLPQ